MGMGDASIFGGGMVMTAMGLGFFSHHVGYAGPAPPGDLNPGWAGVGVTMMGFGLAGMLRGDSLPGGKK